MDKNEYKQKLEQLKGHVAEGDYAAAAAVADEINWKKVRNANTLCMVGDVYEKLGRHDACREVLLQAYDHSPVGRTILSRLAQVAIEMKNLAEAEEYYKEFLGIAPQDNMRYVLAYQISCLKGAPLGERIAILEALKEQEFTEKWAYELAALYGQAFMRDKCVEICDELILWFGDGEYVERALDLKRKFQPLTPAQEEKYQSLRDHAGMVEISYPNKTAEEASAAGSMPEVTVQASKFNTMNLQEELASGMQQIMNATRRETVADTMSSIKKIVNDIPYLQGESEENPLSATGKINARVDESLREDFRERLGQTGNYREDMYGQMSLQMPDQKVPERQVTGQMNIEDVLAEWERTKRAAEEAIAAAEQNKLEMEKESALMEAGEIMERLKTLIPMLSAKPGEDLPQEEETVASALVPDTPVQAKDSDTDDEAGRQDVPPENEPVSVGDPVTGDDGQYPTSGEEQMPMPEQTEWEPQQEMPEDVTPEMPETPETEEIPVKVAVEDEPVSTPQANSSGEDVELERILAQATQSLERNAEAAPSAAKRVPDDKKEALPEIPLPDEDVTIGKTVVPGKLSEEQRELFSYFLPVPGMEEQICQILMGAAERAGNSVTSLSGNILIQGEEGSGKTVLATSLIKAIQQVSGKKDAKIGKISASALNHKDFASLVPRIAGGFLIVDKAGELSAETAARMSQVMEQNTQGMIVLLEDTKQGIKRAMNLDFGFAGKFTEKINIPIFTIDELVDFAKSYAEEMECTIDEMGVLALYNRINNIQKLERATTLAEVKEIVDEAIESAEGTGIKRAFGSLFSKKYNENDYLILHEKDFEN